MSVPKVMLVLDDRIFQMNFCYLFFFLQAKRNCGARAARARADPDNARARRVPAEGEGATGN